MYKARVVFRSQRLCWPDHLCRWSTVCDGLRQSKNVGCECICLEIQGSSSHFEYFCNWHQCPKASLRSFDSFRWLLAMVSHRAPGFLSLTKDFRFLFQPSVFNSRSQSQGICIPSRSLWMRIEISEFKDLGLTAARAFAVITKQRNINP